MTKKKKKCPEIKKEKSPVTSVSPAIHFVHLITCMTERVLFAGKWRK